MAPATVFYPARGSPSVEAAAESHDERLGRELKHARPARWLLVGAPNVGKSALFNRLTNLYVTVSNYPGTSVELTSALRSDGDRPVEVVDTPGLYSLLAVTEDERVARRAVLDASDATIIHVVDASHLERALPLTLQLLALQRPLVLACNLMDEAEARGAAPDLAALEERLGIPVVGTVATTGRGVDDLARRAALAHTPVDGWGLPEPYAALARRVAHEGEGARALIEAELALAGDPEFEPQLAAECGAWPEIANERERQHGGPEGYAVGLATSRRRMALALLDGVIPSAGINARDQKRLDNLLLSPWTGIPLIALVLYLAFYQFVGRFGAGTAVDWIEGVLFGRWIEPASEAAVRSLVPWEAVQDLLVGPYGLLPLGVRYAVAIVLPIVGAFFLVFAALEDSGYLPRLALLLDRAFKAIGLSGRAVIPLVLGFGCNTMATLVTRTLETRRERVITTLLLALAIPCSAQLGVVLGILSIAPGAVMIWMAVMLAVFLGVGWFAARLLPGEPPVLHMELPRLRLPRPGNVLVKTGTRMRWYFAEIFPLFLLASVLLWFGDLTGLLQAATRLLEPAVEAISLPAAAAPAFLYGFFRRDFGAAGLYDLAGQGALGPAALTTAAVTITLFVPCVAQFLVMRKERGLSVAVTVLVVATTVAFAVGGAVGWTLRAVGGWQ
ncbi:MAG TPA: ferrous iron transport protein B [Gemmatimonadales bacterium]|nr:ferrous iron transport protein B [Gemmatimonadales bacterium]